MHPQDTVTIYVYLFESKRKAEKLARNLHPVPSCIQQTRRLLFFSTFEAYQPCKLLIHLTFLQVMFSHLILLGTASLELYAYLW